MSAELAAEFTRVAQFFFDHPIAVIVSTLVLGILVGLIAAWLYFSVVILEGAFW